MINEESTEKRGKRIHFSRNKYTGELCIDMLSIAVVLIIRSYPTSMQQHLNLSPETSMKIVRGHVSCVLPDCELH